MLPLEPQIITAHNAARQEKKGIIRPRIERAQGNYSLCHRPVARFLFSYARFQEWTVTKEIFLELFKEAGHRKR